MEQKQAEIDQLKADLSAVKKMTVLEFRKLMEETGPEKPGGAWRTKERGRGKGSGSGGRGKAGKKTAGDGGGGGDGGGKGGKGGRKGHKGRGKGKKK